MPIIRIDYDIDKAPKKDIEVLSIAVRKIVMDITQIEDVIVYANSSEIRIAAHPIEVFVHMSAHKIKDLDQLMATLKERISNWKKENNFPHPINLSLVPEPWKIEIDI